MSSLRKNYAIVGTGSRAGMFIHAIISQYPDQARLVALCDLSHSRMNWYTAQLPAPAPTYHADDFTRM
ncbi:MAG: gfo/Idh/MocA family oxidoreductase, partial [Chloroflexi bacterium]|nr:gfo/Idh/MocA family oxidoreductase [Chloroflexota bacterium]